MTREAVVRLAGVEYRVRVENGAAGETYASVEGPSGSRRFRVDRLGDDLLLLDGSPVEARVTSRSQGGGVLEVRGERWPVAVLSGLEAALARAAGTAGSGTAAQSTIRAPMPGRVLAVEAEEGRRVNEGAPLFILEAMKMENEIRSPRAGVVRQLRVTAGDAVEGDQPLCDLVADDAGPAPRSDE